MAKKTLTQDECKALWEFEKSQLLRRIKYIDDLTPWSEHEPDWWVEMDTIRHLLTDSKPNYRSEVEKLRDEP